MSEHDETAGSTSAGRASARTGAGAGADAARTSGAGAEPAHTSGAAPAPVRWGQGTWWEGRSNLLVPLIMAAFSTYLLVGILVMPTVEDADPPGPRFFPAIIMVAGYVLAVLLAIACIRHPEPVEETFPEPDADELKAREAAEEEGAFTSPLTTALASSQLNAHPEEGEAGGSHGQVRVRRSADLRHRTHSDFAALGWAAGGFAAFAALIVPMGWIIAAAILFWCVCRSMGSRRPLFDLVLALTFASLVYLGFDVALGLNLPSGILGGL
ncbi:tripartite tricarboxylate transporter TctB family protein [Brevibacterium rongguiense]|uniref:tripartite tricarboxylate transporter TctB family protein n=1 Tax=Brevibacterium rongguiense TaxID=2695267 RepID=UPI002E29EC55|nr:tripartite tricarboxylate transporter TctB family protein [Brevibacterium rongguiense]